MHIEKSKIAEGTGMCEVMNVKVLPADVKNLILEEGIYECYKLRHKTTFLLLGTYIDLI